MWNFSGFREQGASRFCVTRGPKGEAVDTKSRSLVTSSGAREDVMSVSEARGPVMQGAGLPSSSHAPPR